MLQRICFVICNSRMCCNRVVHIATNMIWLQHLPFATKLGLLQRFFVIAQGLEVSSARASEQ